MKSQKSALELSDGEILEIARQLRVAYELKRTLRYNTEREIIVCTVNR